MKKRTLFVTLTFLAVLYPLLLLILVAVPASIWHAFDAQLSDQVASQLLVREKQVLGISSSVPINLVLVDKKSLTITDWTGQGSSFSIKISQNTVSKYIIRHEMYHVARVLRCGIVAEENWFKHHWLRYLYIEEPLAIVYEIFGLDLDII